MSVNDTSLSVLVCRGCCCGTHDGPDHERHLDVITNSVIHAAGRVKVTNCIGPCDRKNVVVVRTRPPVGRWTARYFSAVDDVEVEALCSWFAAGVLEHPEPIELSAVRFEWPLPRRRPAE